MKIGRLLLLAAVIASTPACATFATNLPKVTAAIQDGTMILDSLETFARSVFVVKPDAAMEAKVGAAIARTRTALAFAFRTTAGAGDLGQQKIDDAFSEFKVAYGELLALLGPLGVSISTGAAVAATVKASVSGGALVVPDGATIVPRL